MPIVSFSINENLREFINKLVSKNQYENKSKLVRDALLRLMSTMDASSLESISELNMQQLDKKIVGNMIIVIPNDYMIQKKLNKIEVRYKDQIISKNQHFYGDNVIIFLMVEAKVDDLQNLVVEINGIEELKNFRYLIVN